MGVSRRDFLTDLGGVALFGLPLVRPDIVLVNGNVITMDRAQPRAQGGGRFLAVGSNADIRALARRGTRILNLAGRTVVPGFIDAHSHPAHAGRRHLRYVDCDLRSITAIQNAIRERSSSASWRVTMT